MRRNIALAVVLLLILGLNSGLSNGGSLRGEGDFEFYLDAGSLPLKGEKVLEIFQIAVPTKEIKYEKKDDGFEAVVSVYLAIGRDGEKIYEKQLMIRDSRVVEPSSADLAGFLYISDSCSVDPGIYHLTVRLEDRSRRKKTLLGALRNKHFYSLIENELLDIRSFDHTRIVMSDPFLLWGRDSDGRFIPNPMSVYGLKNDTLTVFTQARLPDGVDRPEIEIYMTILNDRGMVVDSLGFNARVRGGRAAILGRFDVNKWEAGGYRVNISASSRPSLFAMTGKDFNIAWELLNWQRPRRDVLGEARIIFNDFEFDEFKSVGIGQQESILNEFWKKLDPTPHTAVNENYEIFTDRVRYADSHFSDHRKGSLTDRGQIYVRFGPPEDILEESVPFNRTDLDEVIDKLDDQYKVVIHNTYKGFGTEAVNIYDMTTDRAKLYRGGGMDTGAYQLWLYSLKGRPLFERDDLMSINSGLRFLFIDKDGVGAYVLVGTSDDFKDESRGSSSIME
ncbi:MAG: GWxTD domain-containing protein [Candidatus Krumholzibacteriota bacterium]|nr:GWxTD domain-containing protein [Candidatus Krumholzibacteriota bacterium]